MTEVPDGAPVLGSNPLLSPVPVQFRWELGRDPAGTQFCAVEMRHAAGCATAIMTRAALDDTIGVLTQARDQMSPLIVPPGAAGNGGRP